MNFSRFREPTPSDDIAECQRCHDRCHYEYLDDDGYCTECSEIINEEKQAIKREDEYDAAKGH